MVPVTILSGFLDEAIGDYCLLDSVITLVDAMHGERQLEYSKSIRNSWRRKSTSTARK